MTLSQNAIDAVFLDACFYAAKGPDHNLTQFEIERWIRVAERLRPHVSDSVVEYVMQKGMMV